MTQRPTPLPTSALHPQPLDVYRFVKAAEFADSLCSGFVWLSTLGECRRYENIDRGDVGEGTKNYNTGYAEGDRGDPNIENRLARAGMGADACKNIIISNNTNIERLPDAFVLCAALSLDGNRFKETFGNYCLKISNPNRFMIEVAQQLHKVQPTPQAACGRIIYRKREYQGLEPDPGLIGFIKPQTYSWQHEFRFIWTTAAPAPLIPFALNVPSISDLCTRVL